MVTRPRRKERGFTLIELLIVVAILGVLAAVVVPNVGRFLGRGQEEARRAEFHDVSTAVTALMVENNLSSIPNRYTTNDAPCTTGTQDMTKYPDNTSNATTPGGKVNDPTGTPYNYAGTPPDKVGYVLYGHDIKGSGAGGNDDGARVNYVNFNKTTYCYTVDANGTVHQYKTDGTEQSQ